MADPGGGRLRHDPVQQLNARHAEQLLDIARALAGHPDAVSAHATSIDDVGIEMVVATATGTTTVPVPFAVPASGPRRRLAFRDLAARAAALLDASPQRRSS
ncbi:MAG: DUF2470 domain-containing protein [Acidimicrobiia bacterium]